MSGEPSRTLRIALAQVDCQLGDLESNVARAREAIEEARAQQADIVVFPELSLTGYSLGAVADDVAIAPDDPTIIELSREAGDMALVLGFVESGPVAAHNSAVYVQDGRILYVQRKTYLPTYGMFEEHKHFREGQVLRAFTARAGRLALLVCNDAWQSPLAFLAVHDGAQALLVPASSGVRHGDDASFEVEADWETLLRGHARFLQAFVVFVNRVGEEPGVSFWGGSRIIDPWGYIIAQAPRYEPAVVVGEIDLLAVRRRRREAAWVKDGRVAFLARQFTQVAGEEG